MRLRSLRRATLALGLCALTAAAGLAGIQRLDLDAMAALMDDAVVGTIVDRHAIRIDHPVDGPEMYFTHLTIEGRSLVSGKAQTVVVTHYGGWVDAEHGSDVDVAPSAEDARVGNEVVAFYAWTPDMGGELAANALVAMRGGLYRVARGERGAVVLGRGAGYAVSGNRRLEALEGAVAAAFRRRAPARRQEVTR